MAHTWGPVEHPVEHNSAGPMAGHGEGTIKQPAPVGSENYNATDGRHNKADHQGWDSVDPNGGEVSDTDFADGRGRFPDGPGVWRQT